MSDAVAAGSSMSSRVPGLALDRMLARLARWLRPVGVDVLCRPELELRALAGMAERDGRVLVTRRTRLGHVRPRVAVIVIRAARVKDQLQELAAALPALRPDALTAPPRCSGCNVPLGLAPSAEASVPVPLGLRDAGMPVWRCPRCRRLTWGTAHRDRVLSALGDEAPAEGQGAPFDGGGR